MIKKISWSDIVDLLSNAKEQIILLMPAIHEEWVTAIKMNRNLSCLAIKICIDNSESVIRSGYGSIDSLDKLRTIHADIKECDDLRVNFISVDDSSYCLFIESRIIAGNPKGYNAVSLDTKSTVTIIKQFFPEMISAPPLEKIDVIAKPLIEEKAEKVRIAIKNNPPSEPDLERLINTYSTFFQYAEIHFDGANLQSKTINIPPDALPFKDEELRKRMKTRYSLFTNEQTKKWESLLDMKAQVEQLRTKYLTPCKLKRERSILKKENKIAFDKAFEELKVTLKEAVKNIIGAVQTEIQISKKLLKSDLTMRLANGPAEEFNGIDEQTKLEMIEDYVNEIMAEVKIPSAHKLISNIKLDVQYAYLTVEDLSDKEFLAWFKEKGLITGMNEESLGTVRKAFEIKK